MDVTNNGINSTKGSEDINKNNSSSIGFVHQETKNIIIDNKEGITYEDNIRDYPYDNDNENDMKNDSLDISKKSSPDMKNNEVQNNIQNDEKDENPRQTQRGNTNPDDEAYDDKN